MQEMIEANWLLLVIALVIGIAVAWFVFAGTRRMRVDMDRRDTLDEGAAPPSRNQALIDSAPAASPVPAPPATPAGLAGAGVAVAAAVEDAEIAAEHASAGSDDLTRIKGLGPKLAATLNDLGITRFDQIAAWTDADIARIDARLGRFQGRIARDGWVEQAGFLANDDIEGFRARFGAV